MHYNVNKICILFKVNSLHKIIQNLQWMLNYGTVKKNIKINQVEEHLNNNKKNKKNDKEFKNSKKMNAKEYKKKKSTEKRQNWNKLLKMPNINYKQLWDLHNKRLKYTKTLILKQYLKHHQMQIKLETMQIKPSEN